MGCCWKRRVNCSCVEVAFALKRRSLPLFLSSTSSPVRKIISECGITGTALNKSTHLRKRNETHTAIEAPTPADMTTHREEHSPRGSAHVGADEKMNEPVVQVLQYPAVPKCEAGANTRESKNNDEEDDEEPNEGTAEFCAPIELLAEFLKAVMEKDYELAKKLCQMILIYEPENSEAKLFLPLIEERLTEEAQEGYNSEDSTSDYDEDDESDDDDDDDESNSADGGDDDDDDDDDEESNSSRGDDDDEESNSDRDDNYDDDDDTETGTDSDEENISSSNREDEELQRDTVSP